jgi:hypothetical protein
VEGEVDYSVDLFPEKSFPEHSEHWTISYHNTYKIVNNTLNSVSYLLYQCGTEPPANAVSDHHMAIPVPLPHGIVLTSTTYVPHVELLTKRRDVTYVGNPALLSSPCVINMVDDGSMNVIPGQWDVGHNASDLPNHLADNAHAVVIANAWTDTSTPRHMVVAETAEKTNKAVFEWHKVYGALYNMEGQANAYFQETADRYDCGRANADFVANKRALSNAGDGDGAVKVLWAYWIDYYGTTGWSLGHCPNYYCEYAEDCRAEFMEPEVPGSIDCWGNACMTDEEFNAFAKDADVWIYPSENFNEVYKSKKAALDQYASVKSQQVYDTYKSGPNTWFEQRMAEYDVVLQDFCQVVKATDEATDTHKREYFRNVFTEPVGSLPLCTDVDAPFVTQASECVVLVEEQSEKEEESADGGSNDKNKDDGKDGEDKGKDGEDKDKDGEESDPSSAAFAVRDRRSSTYYYYYTASVVAIASYYVMC